MAPLGSTISELNRHRRNLQKLGALSLEPRDPGAVGDSVLTEVPVFGRNPGNLRMFAYVPEDLPPAAPLVVVLHGCTQDARGYDRGAGWSVLAERHGFALVMPQQRKGNNPGRCFNWFEPADTSRDSGEALSIRQMIATMVADHDIDESRVFVTGLSAGGAMTSAMLAAYPELFAGGAIVAGLPYRAASNLSQALDHMFHGGERPEREWGDLVRAASPHKGPWPKVSVWHGSADTTVSPLNAAETVKQWRDVHGLAATAHETVVDGVTRRAYADASGTELVEEFTIPGMAHGTPLATGDEAQHAGIAGPYLIEVGISSGHHIVSFWGLTEPAAKRPARKLARPAKIARPKAAPPAAAAEAISRRPRPAAPFDLSALLGKAFRAKAEPSSGALDIGAVINRALKAAGLLK